ncbi:16S rRNA (guanine(527)-N(7))-methyltransferase RsmG [Altericista sp. CCNU0014]|uniref:16S rRNA (guanine(527)-N(7))-methyltransferase RsmG n=1 Tax=Altericista sp. CCNU0014 TaxID=3082949 RepID=UPI00384FABAD
MTLPKFLDLWQSTLNWSPSEQQQAQFQALLDRLCILNAGVNLTRITSPEAFWEKHLWDSLWGIQLWLDGPPQTLRAIDIGTGGGFPGIPAAIALPTWQVTLLDSTRKKIACLETLCQALSLSSAHPVCDRAETLGHRKGDRAAYDVALIRAVGPVSSCAEYALPFLKIGGTAILYRGQWTLEEERVLQRALPQLGGELAELRRATTPLTRAQRHGLYLHKVEPTPATFPRKVGLPSQHPLGL